MRQARHLRRPYAVARILGARTALTVLAVTFIVGACGGGEATPIEPTKHAAALTIVSGDGQTGEAGTQLAQALVVEVTDEGGAPLAGQSVTFTAGGGGSLSASSSTTDAEGHAQTFWTLGTSTAVVQTVSAGTAQGGAGDRGKIFHVTVRPGQVHSLTRMSVDGQSAHPGTEVNYPPSVQAVDQYGNRVPGVTVHFDIGSGSGTITGASATTDSLGVASVGSWTLGPDTGANTLIATAAGSAITGDPVLFTATAGADFWMQRHPLPAPRQLLAGASDDSILYVIGGMNELYRAQPDVYVYHAATDTWTLAAPIPNAFGEPAAAVVNGILYVVGEQDLTTLSWQGLQAYDPATNTWTNKAPLPAAGAGMAVGVMNGLLYVVGGQSNAGENAMEAYDPKTDSWSIKSPMPTGRSHLAVGVANGILYAIGGDGPAAATTVEAYDPATGTWTTKAPMPTARASLAVASIDGILYAVGGQKQYTTGDPGFLPLNVVEAYDPATDSWAMKAALPTARARLAAGVINGVLYVVGGMIDFSTSTPTAVLEAYQP